MKKILLLLLILFSMMSIPEKSRAQTLYFCEGVSETGFPIGQSNTFNISKSGGYFYFLLRLNTTFNCTSVKYEIYKKDEYAKESYNTYIMQEDIQPSWKFCWKKVTFYEAGKFVVYAYDSNAKLLASATVNIKFK